MRAGAAPGQQIAVSFQISGKCPGAMRAGSGITRRGYASSGIPKRKDRPSRSSFCSYYAEEAEMHLGSLILIIWLVIGGFAAGQRGDYTGPVNCGTAATTAVTILAGPLNYMGVDPHINCTAPHTSN
jgi:hypothetical protein